MRQTGKIFAIGMRVVLRDAVMLVLIPAPFAIGALFWLLAPLMNNLLVEHMGFSIAPWYPLVDALMAALTPVMLTVCSAFLMLEECDEGIGGYYGITPAGRLPYLAARIGMPALWGFLCGVLVLWLFGLSSMPVRTVAALALVCALSGIATAMLIVAIAANRVEGLAASKLSGIALLGLLVAWFVPTGARWAAAILPSFWMGELSMGKPLLPCLAGGAATSVLWIWLFTGRFLRKLT